MTAMILPIESLVDLLTEGSALQVVVVIALLAAGNLALLYWVGRYTWRYLNGARSSSVSGPPAINRTRDSAPAEDMADLVSSAILLVNSDDRILRFNRAALDMFGYTAAELTDLTYQRLLVLPGEALESAAGLRRTASGAALLEHAGYGLRKDGGRFAAEVSVRLVRSHPIEALIEIRDSFASSTSTETIESGRGSRELIEITRRMAQLARQVRLGDVPPSDQADFLRALRDYAGRAEALISPDPEMLQLVNLGRWLEGAVKGFSEERAEVLANITLPPLEEVNFYCLLKTQPLARLLAVLLAYAEDALFSPEVAVHLTHHRSPGPGDPAAPAAGIDRRLSLLFIVGAGPQQGAVNVLTTQEDPVPTDPRLRLAFELADAIGGKLSVDANDKTGWLFQLSFTSRCFGMSSQVLLGSPDVEGALSGSAAPAIAQLADVPGPAPFSRSRASGIRILLVSYTADLREWARDLLLSEGYQLIHVEPASLLRHLHEDSTYQLIILESGHEIEEDFDPTFEIRQLLGIDSASILLIDNYSSNPDRTYFDQQLRLRFPMRNSAFMTAVRKLVRSTELLA